MDLSESVTMQIFEAAKTLGEFSDSRKYYLQTQQTAKACPQVPETSPPSASQSAWSQKGTIFTNFFMFCPNFFQVLLHV